MGVTSIVEHTHEVQASMCDLSSNVLAQVAQHNTSLSNVLCDKFESVVMDLVATCNKSGPATCSSSLNDNETCGDEMCGEVRDDEVRVKFNDDDILAPPVFVPNENQVLAGSSPSDVNFNDGDMPIPPVFDTGGNIVIDANCTSESTAIDPMSDASRVFPGPVFPDRSRNSSF